MLLTLGSAWSASLAPLTWLALKVLLNAKGRVKSCQEVGHLTKSADHSQSILVGHLKSVLLKDLIKINYFLKIWFNLVEKLIIFFLLYGDLFQTFLQNQSYLIFSNCRSTISTFVSVLLSCQKGEQFSSPVLSPVLNWSCNQD